MAEFHDEIDSVFKNRFSGVKNDHFDSATGWAKLKSELGANAAYHTAAAGRSFYFGAMVKIAASVLIAVTAISDSENLAPEFIKPISSQGIADTKSSPLARSWEKPELPNKITESESASYTALIENSVNATAPLGGGDLAGINDSLQSLDFEESNSALANHNAAEMLTQNFQAKYSTSVQRDFECVDLMPLRPYVYEQHDIVDRNHEPENPIISKWMDDHIWFFRGGALAGKGESNSLASQGEWAINPAFAFGYGFSFTDRSFVSVEIGVMRRSGNVIERVRKQAVSPIIASFATLTNDKNTVEMHRGLVADRLDFIHFPLMFNWVATQGWNLSAGGFGNYLYAARNQSITVYNARDYVKTKTGIDEVTSLEGLTRLRYGMIFGAERQLTQHMSAYAQIIMPLNNPIDERGDYESFGTTSKSADGQLGLLYSF